MRVWSSSADDGSVHAMGNGQLLAYGRGPNLIALYGPPYSSPKLLAMSLATSGELLDEAQREPGTAIWQHHTRGADGQELAEWTEFVASELPAYVRCVRSQQPGLRWLLAPHAAAQLVPDPSSPSAWLLILRPGQRIMNYPSTHWAFHYLLLSGQAHGELDGDGRLAIEWLPGEARFTVVGASEYPLATQYAEEIATREPAELLAATRRYWQAFTQRRSAATSLPANVPAEPAEALDSVAVLLKTQQALDGGVMAGHAYPLAYIRDQYGTVRGMLSLGMIEEAHQNLDFRLRKFQHFGTLQTAETMGCDCARHVHENDDVEGPGYTILQARDYALAVGDPAAARPYWPMLSWCWEVQTKHLVAGLLPFNGDETYVAGGFYPRSGLLHGSADATLVFVEAGLWLASWAMAQGFWTQEYAARQLSAVAQARAAYRQHFWDGERLWANAPERARLAPAPRFRHGVCEARCDWFGWTQRSASGRYLCPVCTTRQELPAEEPARMEVNSVALLPAYLGTQVLSRAELTTVVDHVLAQQLPDGHIPTVPGTVGCVGYDPGLMLISLVELGHPGAEQAYRRVLRMLDRSLAWNEYYGEGDRVLQHHCRARPWESGINAEALVRFLARRRELWRQWPA